MRENTNSHETYEMILEIAQLICNPAILMHPVVLTRCSFYFFALLYAVDSVNPICLLELLACSFYSQ